MFFCFFFFFYMCKGLAVRDEFGVESSTEDFEELPDDSAKSIQARR